MLACIAPITGPSWPTRTIQLLQRVVWSWFQPTTRRAYRSRSSSAVGGDPPVNSYIAGSAYTAVISAASDTRSGESDRRSVTSVVSAWAMSMRECAMSLIGLELAGGVAGGGGKKPHPPAPSTQRGGGGGITPGGGGYPRPPLDRGGAPTRPPP